MEDYNKKEEIDNCDKDSDSAIVCFDLLDEIEENHKKIEQIRNESRWISQEKVKSTREVTWMKGTMCLNQRIKVEEKEDFKHENP